MNVSWSVEIVTRLARAGVRDVVLCAGARNSPLVATFAKTEGLELHSFFEERSAAFFALGVARQTARPIAIVTTSGTAAAELLPAAIEAHHTGVPLILVTADRPKRLRGTGAPQAIDQTGLFAKFVSIELDLEVGQEVSLENWNHRSPVHLNVCFDEPLIDEKIEALDLREAVLDAPESFLGKSPFETSAGAEWAALRLTKFLRGDGPLVVMVGTLETERERDAAVEFLGKLGAPVYLEATSGLREKSSLRSLTLRSGDKVLGWALKSGMLKRALRIGGIPTVRVWRDLDEESSGVEVLSLSALPFAGLGRGEFVCASVGETLSRVEPERLDRELSQPLFVRDRENEKLLENLYLRYPRSEPALVRGLSELVPLDSLVYLGNSLPIREWDLAASWGRGFSIEANRGVNGIDGQISTFLGLSHERRENWALIGDLTALYDLAGPWALRTSRANVAVRIVVMNNGGGMIFSRIFKEALFENRHDIEFEGWARMWKMNHQKWTEIPKIFQGGYREVIEIVPDDSQTKSFWDEYDSMWSL